MAVKRSGQDGDNFEGGAQPPYQANGSSTVAQDIFLTRPILGSSFPATELKQEKPGEEKISLFWRVFGGTILSIAALAVVTMYNSVATNISELRANLATAQADAARQNADLRAELNRVHEASGERLRVAEFNTRMTTVWDGIKSVQTQGAGQTAQLAAQKSEIDANKERLTKLGADAETIRKDFGSTLELLKKEQVATTDAIKKDVAVLDTLKERLTAVAAELKTVGAEAAKTRQELDANRAQDAERKSNRDKQFKALDDAVMELSKTLQGCRERLVRLEVQSATPKPAPAPAPAPAKKPSVSRPAKPAPAPAEEEEKPEESGK